MKPFASPVLNKADVHAIKLLAEGKADGGAQVHALNVVLELLCDTYGLSYRPDDLGGERDTSFAEGKRWVGLQLRRIITQPVNTLVKEIPDAGRHADRTAEQSAAAKPRRGRKPAAG